MSGEVALVTDSRISRAARALAVRHVSPEAARGGPIAAVQEGDIITIDVEARKLELEISPEVLHARLARWQPHPPRCTTGVSARYAALVSSAPEGAVLGIPAEKLQPTVSDPVYTF